MPRRLQTTRRRVRWLVRWLLLGALIGLISGASAAALLESLLWATETRVDHSWLLFLLPLGGLLVGMAYHYAGGRAAGGSVMIIDEIHEPSAWVPRRMAPMVLAGTVTTHVLGGSGGREGAAVQMSGSLTDWWSRRSGIAARDRRTLLVAAIAGGFGAAFGVPFAGWVFALEVRALGRGRLDAVLPALVSSFVGDAVVRAVGVDHEHMPHFTAVHLSIVLLAKVALAGLAFGAVSRTFVGATHGVKAALARTVAWPPLRPVLGGAVVIGLTYVVGTRDYLGLSLPLIPASIVAGTGVAAGAFAWKLAFTAITLGSGFPGGEVTPLFVIGATVGVSLGRLLDAPITLIAAIGFVAVFAGAANTPLACTVMGVEMFGWNVALLMAVGCALSFAVSSHHGIYGGHQPAHTRTSIVRSGINASAAARLAAAGTRLRRSRRGQSARPAPPRPTAGSSANDGGP